MLLHLIFFERNFFL